jgi:hypothetical protein
MALTLSQPLSNECRWLVDVSRLVDTGKFACLGHCVAHFFSAQAAHFDSKKFHCTCGVSPPIGGISDHFG